MPNENDFVNLSCLVTLTLIAMNHANSSLCFQLKTAKLNKSLLVCVTNCISVGRLTFLL